MSSERFYVIELEGQDTMAMGNPGKAGQTSCYVLDRAYCHQEVARFNEPRGVLSGQLKPLTKEARIAWVRERSAAEVDRLNAEYSG